MTEPLSTPAAQGTVAADAVLYARFDPAWGRMMLCERGQFGAVEYRIAPSPEALPASGVEDGGEPIAWRDLTFDQRYCLAIDVAASIGYAIGKPDDMLHHVTGERITRKDLNNAHRMGREEGRLAAELLPPLASDAPAPAPSGSGVRVKPLEWSEPNPAANYPEWRARDSNNKFEAVIDTSRAGCFGKFPLTINGIDAGEKFDTLPQAKARAQAVYEARILSALASDASPRGEAVGYMRAGDNDGKSFWCSRDKNFYYTEPVYLAHPAPATVEMREEAAQAALARIRKVRDGYADQAKFADVDEARLFRQFVERLDRAALAPATEGRKDEP